MRKQISKNTSELNTPLNLTWSYYKDEDEACGKCDNRVLQLRCFPKVRIKDPIPYKFKPSYI